MATKTKQPVESPKQATQRAEVERQLQDAGKPKTADPDTYAAELAAMKVADLRSKAAEAGIDGAAGMKKAELVDALAERMASRSVTSDNLGEMSLTELRKYALANGWSTATKYGKTKLLELLRKYPDGPQSAPAVDPAVRAEVGKRQAQVTTEQPAKPAKPAKKAAAKPASKPAAPKQEESDANAARCASAYVRMVEVGDEWGWSVTRSGDKEITCFNKANQEQTIVVTYPEPGVDLITGDARKCVNAPWVQYQRSSDHKGRRLLNVGAALKVMRGEIK